MHFYYVKLDDKLLIQSIWNALELQLLKINTKLLLLVEIIILVNWIVVLIENAFHYIFTV